MIYENFIWEAKFEDTLITKTNLSPFYRVETLEGDGLTKVINTYSPSGSIEDVENRQGNSSTFESNCEQNDYTVNCYQGGFSISDEEAEDDNTAIALMGGVANAFVNEFNEQAIGAMLTTEQEVEIDFTCEDEYYLYDKIMDMLEFLGEDAGEAYVLVSFDNLAWVQRQLRGDLMGYNGKLARSGYVGSIAGVPIYVSKAMPVDNLAVGTAEGVSVFLKGEIETEKDYDPDARITYARYRKYGIVALTNGAKVVKAIAPPPPVVWKGLKFKPVGTTNAVATVKLEKDGDITDKYEYSLDEGKTWTDLILDTTIVSLNAGDEMCVRAKAEISGRTYNEYIYFGMTGSIVASGNINSMITPDFDGLTNISAYPCAFYQLFEGCRALTTPPELPATTLAESCYYAMFEGCRALTTPPELPATTLAESCYGNMFRGCTSLTTAPELPATTLSGWCYVEMFFDCTNIKLSDVQTVEYTKPYRIPTEGTGTTATNALYHMFNNTGGYWTGTPNINQTYYLYDPLPTYEMVVKYQDEVGATIHSDDTFETYDPEAFVPEIINIDGYRYKSMERTATLEWVLTYEELEVYPGLRLTALSDGSVVGLSCDFPPYAKTYYYSLDEGFSWDIYVLGVTPAVTLNAGETVCFRCQGASGGGTWGLVYVNATGSVKASGNVMSMIEAYGFEELTTLPECDNGALSSLFRDCTALVDASELLLPATTLASKCYSSMFTGCTNLATPPALPATTLIDKCYSYMFQGCTSIKLSDVQTTEYTKPYRIPSEGTGIDAPRALDGMFENTGGTFRGTPEINKTYYLYDPIPDDAKFTSNGTTVMSTSSPMSWSTDNVNWTEASTFTINAGTPVYCKATPSTTAGTQFQATGDTFAISGNIMHLCYGDIAAERQFERMFPYDTLLVDASNLIIPQEAIARYSFSSAFECVNLVHPPQITATTMAEGCFSNMFHNCTSLTEAPELPATTLATDCYTNMFQGCTSLTEAPELPATTPGMRCYQRMFKGCTALAEPPVLNLTSVISQCCYQMFQNCISLTKLPILPATTMATECYYQMFKGCSSIKLASMRSGDYVNEYRIPSEGTGTATYHFAEEMFTDTGGTWKGTPTINTTYYTSNEVI